MTWSRKASLDFGLGGTIYFWLEILQLMKGNIFFDKMRVNVLIFFCNMYMLYTDTIMRPQTKLDIILSCSLIHVATAKTRPSIFPKILLQGVLH